MPAHWSLVSLVKLSNAGTDMQSPSKFVQQALEISQVEDAFRTSGRFDAVVWIHPDHHGADGGGADLLAEAMVAANKIRALPGVADAELLVWRPCSDPASPSRA